MRSNQHIRFGAWRGFARQIGYAVVYAYARDCSTPRSIYVTAPLGRRVLFLLFCAACEETDTHALLSQVHSAI